MSPRGTTDEGSSRRHRPPAVGLAGRSARRRSIRRTRALTRPTIATISTSPRLALAALLLCLAPAACGDAVLLRPEPDDGPLVEQPPVVDDPGDVADLAITEHTEGSLTVTWTQVDDGTGHPAKYRVKYAKSPIQYAHATVGCDVEGTAIGQPMTCGIAGLAAGTAYEVQLAAYREEGGTWAASTPSNVASGQTMAAPVQGMGSVGDLQVADTAEDGLTLTWTQVDDGTGASARYQVRYARPPLTFAEGAVGCELEGTAVGKPLTCRIDGLAAETDYEIQLASYRTEGGAWVTSMLSNIAAGRTVGPVGTVGDLQVTGATEDALTLGWTQVGDGTGEPARYQVRYGAPPLTFAEGAVGCEMDGTAIGQPASCRIEGLTVDTGYEVQLASYRGESGVWVGSATSNTAEGRTTTTGPTMGTVADLRVTAATEAVLSLEWTQVDDGTGQPARYQVRYVAPPLSFAEGAVGCVVDGTGVGEPIGCDVASLTPGTVYALQLVAYRVENGTRADSTSSNVVTASTAAVAEPPSSPQGIWIGADEVARLPMAGPAWDQLLETAKGSCGSVDLTDGEQDTNTCVLAKALVFVRTGEAKYRDGVLKAVRTIVAARTYTGRALSLGRELGSYVASADLIDLKSYDPALDEAFRGTLERLRVTPTYGGGAANLVACHELRPNNWGTHCGATRAAIAVYLGDAADLARTAEVFRGYLGDRTAYAGLDFGSDLSWQCDPAHPVGINPPGCTRYGHSLDGVIPDDQRRAGSFRWPAPKTNYAWEALQGAVAAAVILERAGYPAFEWSDKALLRAVRWLYDMDGYPPSGDDEWLVHVINHHYGTHFPAPTPARAGKSYGWTDWTLG